MKSTKKLVSCALALSLAVQSIPVSAEELDTVDGQKVINVKSSSTFDTLIPNLELSEGNTLNISFGLNSIDVSNLVLKVFPLGDDSNVKSVNLEFTIDGEKTLVNQSVSLSDLFGSEFGGSVLAELYKNDCEKIFGPKRFEVVSSFTQEVVEEVDTVVDEAEKVVEDLTAPSSSSELECKINSSSNEIIITQKGIYDLESGLDVNSVKAYVYPSSSEDKGSSIQLSGNDFSDFSGSVKVNDIDSDLVVEVYAKDLAGNESQVSSKTLNGKAKVSIEIIDSLLASDNIYFNGESYQIKANQKFIFRVMEKLMDGDLTRGSLVINTNPDDINSGVVFKGTLTKDGLKADTSFGNIDILEGSSITTEDDFIYTSDYLLSIKDSIPSGTSLYFWSASGDDTNLNNYIKLSRCLELDSKAPTCSDEINLHVTEDNTLLINQSGIIDEGSDINMDKVCALVSGSNTVEPVRVNLSLNPQGDGSFSGSLDLKTLASADGSFTVDVYATDNVGNENKVSSGKIDNNVSIDSKEVLNVDGFTYEKDNVKWYRHNSEIRIESNSHSAKQVYNGARIIINEDNSNAYNKVLSEFKLGTKEDLTNITDNPYFELVSSAYNVGQSDEHGYDYVNLVNCLMRLKDKAYNKTFNVWIVYYTDKGIESPYLCTEGSLKTDYTNPNIEVSKLSGNTVIKVNDEESGIASVVAYDANGLIVSDSYNEKDGMVLADDLNATTVTVTDNVNNKITYDLVADKPMDSIGSDTLPDKPAEDDSFIDLEKPSNDGAENPDNGNNDSINGDSSNSGSNDNSNNDNSNNDNSNNDNSNDVDKPGDNNFDNGNNDSNNSSNNSNNDSSNDSSNDDLNSGTDDSDKPSTDDSENPSTDDSDKPSTDDSENPTNNSGDDNSDVTVKPEDNSNENLVESDNVNPNTILPNTGGVSSMLVGLVGVVSSALGFCLVRKRKL